jgi:hypothetical protein
MKAAQDLGRAGAYDAHKRALARINKLLNTRFILAIIPGRAILSTRG